MQQRQTDRHDRTNRVNEQNAAKSDRHDRTRRVNEQNAAKTDRQTDTTEQAE